MASVIAVAGICSSIGGSLPSSVLQHRSSSDEGLDGRVPPSPSAADPLSGEFSLDAPNTQAFRADTPDRNAYSLGKREGLRNCGTPLVVRSVRLTRAVLIEEERPVLTSIHAARNSAEDSRHETHGVRTTKLTVLNEDGNLAHGSWHKPSSRGFGSGKDQPVVSDCGHGNSQMPRASVTSEAIAILKHRQEQGLSIDSYMFVDILKQCSRQKDLVATRLVHEYISQSGLQQQRHVANTLLGVYVKCDRLQDARRVFDGLERTNRNVITWNTMIGGYAKHGCGGEAYRLFVQMNRQGFVADAFTYASILNPSSSAGALEWVREVHGHACKARLESNLRVGSGLVRMYAKSGSIDEARLVFDRMEERDVITWNIMIKAYAENGHGMEAYELFLEMKREGFVADAFTYASILNPSSSAGALEWVREVHGHACKAGLESNLRVGSGLVHMYAKSGSIDDARLVFDRMQERDAITWNKMIGAYAESGRGMEAYRLFLQMKSEGFVPDAFTYASILNASSSAGALEWVRYVHSDAHKAGLDSDVRVGNALVHMYAKSGSIDDARRVFDRMEKRDVFTWNIMIGAYAESGSGTQAYQLFLEMKSEGFVADAFTYASILNPSASAGDLDWVREVHAHALKVGLESNLRVGSGLVHMYAKSGSINEARVVFDKMEERDVITWNIMIGAYAESCCGMEAYQLFLEMKREGYAADAFTYSSILNPSANVGALEWVRDVHGHALEGGLESNLRVGNALVHMYAKSGSIDEARLVFDRMQERNVITWNIMVGAYAESDCGIEAYRLFVQMKREGFVADVFTYAGILNPSSSAGALEWVREVHSDAHQRKLDSDVRVGNALVHMYAKSGSMAEARLVFDRMEERDVITWNVMIGAYAEIGCGMEAYEMFLQMKSEGFEADAFTYASILNPSASAGALEWVRDVHGDAVKAGLESNLRVGNALVHMYAKSGSIDEARVVFDKMKERDVITWNIMIGASAESGCGVEAYQLFLEMKTEGFVADVFTYASILNVSASAGALGWVREIYNDARRTGLDSDVRVGNALVHMYAKSGSIDEARVVFDRMEERDVITWNIMIGTYAESGRGMEAYGLFLKMKSEGFVPDAFTYASILNASASAGALEWVREVHIDAHNAGLDSDVRVGNALVNMYAKSGSIDEARLVFDEMEERDVFTWTTMIGGLAQHGCGHKALKLFSKMNADCVKPSETTFVALLSACSHGGLVDEGRRLFLAMKEDYGVEATVVHYNCMVDLLGRAGHLDEAKLLIDNMPAEPEPVTWRALLGACRVYCNVELGEIAAKEALKLEPKNAAVYVLLSNIYAAARKWEKVGLVRSMMQERGVRKEPGRSWIEVDEKIHEFVVGDTSHPEASATYSELMNLTEKMKAEGYVPDTQLVLQNIDEEDKELALCSHSERLAIAYGLLRIPLGKPIRIFKNLRVCSDCHTATKLISKVTGREIIARDANRFHHFKDGVCSCSDYW